MSIRELLKQCRFLICFGASMAGLAQLTALFARAEDPARFFTVANWRGTFSQDITFVGSGQNTSSGVACHVDYSYVHHLNVSGVVLRTGGWTDSSRLWLSEYQQANPGLIADQTIQQCPPPAQGAATASSDSLKMDGGFFLTIDSAANQYEIEFPQVAVTLALNGDKFETRTSWSEPVTATLPASGFPLSGSVSVPWGQLDEAGNFMYERFSALALYIDNAEQALRSATMVVSWNLEPIDEEEYEVVVEPRAYADWIPKGRIGTIDARGNSLTISAWLQKKGGGTPSVTAKTFQFELVNVFHELGICMNFPVRTPSDKPDLRFEEELNQPLPLTANTISDNQMEVFGFPPFGLDMAQATISSFDFGAYGEIRVTANVAGLDPIVGHLKNDSLKNIPVPKTKPGSHIAEAWLKNNGGGAARLFDDTDEDSFPEGDGHKGDGLSLYEEYRGFVINSTHVRTKPVKKDLFIRNQIRNKEAATAILQFQAASHLDVHHQLDKDEVGPDNVINFNHGWAHNVDQHVLTVVGKEKKTGESFAYSREDALDNSTPGSKSQIVIDPAGPGSSYDLTGEKPC